MVSYPYTLIVSVPLDFFNKVNTTSETNILIGNDGCLRTLARIGAFIFSGAKALAGNGFTIAGILPGRKISRARLMFLTTYYRRFSPRPVTHSVISCCSKRLGGNSISSDRRLINLNIDTGRSKGAVCYNGTGLVGGILPRAGLPRSRVKARICITCSKGCIKDLRMTSIVGRSSGRTMDSLHTTNIRGVIVLANSTHGINRKITHRLKLSSIGARLLPRSGLRRMRGLGARLSNRSGLTFINSNLGSAPILTRDSIKVTVNTLNSSTTIRTTSIMLVSSRPSTVIHIVGVTEEAGEVI